MKFSIKEFFSKQDQIRRKLLRNEEITEEILNGKLHFLCGVFDREINTSLCIMTKNINSIKPAHCVKSVHIRSFFWSKYRKIRTRKNPVLGHISRNSKYRGVRFQ